MKDEKMEIKELTEKQVEKYSDKTGWMDDEKLVEKENLKIIIRNGKKFYEMTEGYLEALKRIERQKTRQKCEKEIKRMKIVIGNQSWELKHRMRKIQRLKKQKQKIPTDLTKKIQTMFGWDMNLSEQSGTRSIKGKLISRDDVLKIIGGKKELHDFAKSKEKSEMLWRSRGRIEACNDLITKAKRMKKEYTYDNYTLNRIMAEINWIRESVTK